MKRKFIMILLVFLAFFLQSTLLKALAINHIQPNLFLILTASFGFMRGKKEGLLVGVLCGFLSDLFWGSLLGIQVFLFAMIGYGNGVFHRLFYDEDIKLPLFLIGISDFLYGLFMYSVFYLLKGDFSFGVHLLYILFPELIYTAFATLILYPFILKINKRLEEDEERSASRFV